MAVPDKLSDHGPVELPPEAGNINAVSFDPNEAWLQGAEPDLQKAAMWRWFATRYEDPEEAVPHDEQGDYLYGDGEPVLADQVLRERFGQLVPQPLIDEVVAAICSEVGNEWALKRMDKAGA